jgi:hypothetical protein
MTAPRNTWPKLCLDCGMEPPISEQGRCAGCQRDHEIRLARKLARTKEEEK